MKTALELLCEDFEFRQRYLLDKTGQNVDKRKKSWKLYGKDGKEAIEATYGHILTALESNTSLSALTVKMGGVISRRFNLDSDEVEMSHLGWFTLVSYFEMGYLKYKAKHIKKRNGKKTKYPTYHIYVTNTDAINSLLESVNRDKVELFPSAGPVGDWEEGFLHPITKYPLIKNASEDTIQKVKNLELTYIKDTLNKLNNTGWRINQPVFEVFKASMHWEKTPFKFSREIDPVKKTSLLIEINAIKGIAERHKNNTFYHLYNLDFRGRIYPNTAFLHEQSSDNAKGLLLLEDSVPLGEEGYYWLCVHAANVWGNDKVDLDDRVKWVQDNIDDILRWGALPQEFRGWMEADKPFSFLAACVEINMLDSWVQSGNNPHDFPSNLPVYIDGSNNGVQHLVAMSKDETIAPLVNLTPSKLPGDVYLYIAEAAMAKVNEMVKALDEDEVDKFEGLFSKYVSLLRVIEAAPDNSEKKALAWKAMLEYKNHNHTLREKLFPVYWSKIKDKKVWRKMLKRNVMTLGYGGTRQGMGEQVVEDTRGMSDYLRDKEPKWGYMLGSMVFDLCYEKLEGPARMLQMFQELAVRENDLNRHLTYTLPITGFPFQHNYRKPKSRDVSFYYGEERIRLTLSIWQEATLDKQKQKRGTAPNIVHSFDAVHLASVVHDALYVITVVHDSFGCHAGNMGQLFYHVREKFIDLYELEPLEYVMAQLDALDLIPEKGTLDVTRVRSSEFSFA